MGRRLKFQGRLQDLAKDAAPLFKKALRFYQGLSGDLVKQSHSLDVFACALDQVSFIGAYGSHTLHIETQYTFNHVQLHLHLRPSGHDHVHVS